MAVYTHLQHDELAILAKEYGLGVLHRAIPIAEGVENSNYRLEYGNRENPQRCILTVYEKRVKHEDVPFYLALMQHLYARGIPAPKPLSRMDGAFISTVREGKLAAMVTFLDGQSVSGAASIFQLEALGAMVARLHEAVTDFPLTRSNALGLDGWRHLANDVTPRADAIAPGLSKLIHDELAFLEPRWPHGLAQGVVHADLFPDNVFFDGERLSGVIDWYFACTDAYLYDLMITMNAWCFDAQHSFQPARASALLRAYNARRTIRHDERPVLPLLARGAALRFLLTRAYDWLHRDPAALVMVKDPMEYARKLTFHQNVCDAKEYGL
jgi:homoserine kinase type II